MAVSQKDSTPVPKLFRSEAPLAVTVTANLDRPKHDRDAKAPYRTATISYAGDSGKVITVPFRVKTHGIWRLKHCDTPPLRWNFSGKDTKGTIFHGVNKPKEVSACRDSDKYEQLVLQEYQLYRIYQLLTPQSHRARLLRMSYADSATHKVEATRYSFVIEDPDQLADRLHGIMVKQKGATADDLDGPAGALVYIFEYLIANTDFSFNGLHNGEMVMRSDGSALIPVAYDFDFSGAVNAPYASPDPKLPIKSVRERMFRGYCAFGDDYPAAFDKVRKSKDAIYALYHDEIGRLMDDRIVKETLQYYDDFFDVIKDQQSVNRYVLTGCQGRR